MKEHETTAIVTAEHDREVRIHIDRNPFESPNPTTGKALYALGNIPAGFQLYREVRGDEEDEPIHNDEEQEHLRPDEHFYSQERRHAGFEIVVDAHPEHVEKKHVSYEQIVRLANPPPPPAGSVQMFTVTYYNGPKANPEGKLTQGHTVKIKNKMVFNVKTTNRS
jgi:Multiubiquitin